MIKTDCRSLALFHAMQHAIFDMDLDQKNKAENGLEFAVASRVRPDKAFNFHHLEMKKTDS